MKYLNFPKKLEFRLLPLIIKETQKTPLNLNKIPDEGHFSTSTHHHYINILIYKDASVYLRI